MRQPTAATLLTLLLGALPASAQYASYVSPGGLAEQEESDREEVLEQIQEARWHFGPLDLEPRLTLGNLSYIGNVFSTAGAETVSDLRAEAAAGLHAYLHLGPKTILAGFVTADYTWWQEQSDLRRLNESFGTRLYGLFNRLQFQLEAGRLQSQRNLSAEVEAPVDVRSDLLEASLDLDLYGPLILFAAARHEETRYFGRAASRALPALDLEALNRTSEILSAGARYEFSERLVLSLGGEVVEATLEVDPQGRSNKSSGPLVQLRFTGNRLSVVAEAVSRDIEFAGRQAAPDRTQTTGTAQVGWRFTERLRAQLYGTSQLDYSALDSASLFELRRTGASLSQELSPRLTVGAFYETGEDEFSTVVSDQVSRVDDHRSFGLTAQLTPTPRLTVNIRAFDSRRDSTDPQFSRSQTTVLSQIQLGGSLLPW